MRQGAVSILIAALAIAAVSCGGGGSGTNTPTIASSTEAPTATPPVISEDDQAERAEVAYPLTPFPQEYDADWSVDQVRRFERFNVLWLGEEFQGLALKRVVRVGAPSIVVPEDSITFFYGDCKVVGAGGAEGGVCNYPLQVKVHPICYRRPEVVADEARQSVVTKVRGNADAQSGGGDLRIWTGDVTVKIYGDTGELEWAAADALVSANGMGARTAAEALPEPELGCEDFQFRPHP